MPVVTLDDMIAEVTTELEYRARVFPRRIQNAGLALQNHLRRRMQVLQEVKRYLEQRRDVE